MLIGFTKGMPLNGFDNLSRTETSVNIFDNLLTNSLFLNYKP